MCGCNLVSPSLWEAKWLQIIISAVPLKGSFSLICHSPFKKICQIETMFLLYLLFDFHLRPKSTWKKRRLEYLLVHSVCCCVVYLSAPSSHPWKPTSACSEIGFVFPGLLKPVNHRAFEGLTYFPAIGEMEHQSFWQLNTSPKKNFDSHTVKVGNTVPSPEQWIEVIWCLVTNWSLVSPIPLPFNMLIAILTLMDHSGVLESLKTIHILHVLCLFSFLSHYISPLIHLTLAQGCWAWKAEERRHA